MSVQQRPTIATDIAQMKVKTKISSSIRYFNLTNSHWEPLMDPWAFEVTVRLFSVLTDVGRLRALLSVPRFDRLTSNSMLLSGWSLT